VFLPVPDSRLDAKHVTELLDPKLQQIEIPNTMFIITAHLPGMVGVSPGKHRHAGKA
jgi:hypothetical protein